MARNMCESEKNQLNTCNTAHRGDSFFAFRLTALWERAHLLAHLPFSEHHVSSVGAQISSQTKKMFESTSKSST